MSTASAPKPAMPIPGNASAPAAPKKTSSKPLSGWKKRALPLLAGCQRISLPGPAGEHLSQAPTTTTSRQVGAVPTPTLLPPAAAEPALGIGLAWIPAKDKMPQVYVPSGEFRTGSDIVRDPSAAIDEIPQHAVYLDAFWIDQTLVTNAMFNCFDRETHHQTGAEAAGATESGVYPKGAGLYGALDITRNVREWVADW